MSQESLQATDVSGSPNNFLNLYRLKREGNTFVLGDKTFTIPTTFSEACDITVSTFKLMKIITDANPNMPSQESLLTNTTTNGLVSFFTSLINYFKIIQENLLLIIISVKCLEEYSINIKNNTIIDSFIDSTNIFVNTYIAQLQALQTQIEHIQRMYSVQLMQESNLAIGQILTDIYERIIALQTKYTNNDILNNDIGETLLQLQKKINPILSLTQVVLPVPGLNESPSDSKVPLPNGNNTSLDALASIVMQLKQIENTTDPFMAAEPSMQHDSPLYFLKSECNTYSDVLKNPIIRVAVVQYLQKNKKIDELNAMLDYAGNIKNIRIQSGLDEQQKKELEDMILIELGNINTPEHQKMFLEIIQNILANIPPNKRKNLLSHQISAGLYFLNHIWQRGAFLIRGDDHIPHGETQYNNPVIAFLAGRMTKDIGALLQEPLFPNSNT